MFFIAIKNGHILGLCPPLGPLCDGILLEEFVVPSQHRAIPPPTVTQPRLTLPVVEGAGPLPPADGMEPEEVEPQSDYELL